MDTITIKPEVIKTAQTFKLALINAGIDFEQVYLFGSQAKGLANESSDIDICVVSKHLPGDSIDNFVKLRKISRPVNIDIEPHTLHPDDFNNKYSTLATEIKEHGILID